ncbi:HNH endonuclease [Scytonema sp. UIC 10036]|uniref:HNH endonuclease n=1 Tax=Scytonema sp. UIC 10036 TaxID=2304196 RepID=UPI0012DA37FC|nr:HNH endonuclease [Scytonema sp. UIC 10036]MUG93748.1 HNH endonuclease [Scytonema sp. UIC 10036]
MAVRRLIPKDIQTLVRQRANCLCKYCHTSEQWQYVEFTIEHIIPLDKNGLDAIDNLALACFHCNRKKSDKTTAIDSDSGAEVSLFNPRINNWNDHFIWSADKLYIIGLTVIGRVTIAALALNRERVISIRSADKLIGRHPPVDDPILVEN